MNVKEVTLKHYILNMVCVPPHGLFFMICARLPTVTYHYVWHILKDITIQGVYSSLMERKANSSISQRRINDEYVKNIGIQFFILLLKNVQLLLLSGLFLQIYFYAEYVFKKSGIPEQNIPYVTLGTGVCECITALTCVSHLFYYTELFLNFKHIQGQFHPKFIFKIQVESVGMSYLLLSYISQGL